VTSDVKPLKLASKDGGRHRRRCGERLRGKYPLARFLYVYVNKAPDKPLGPLVREFWRSCFRRKAGVVIKDGYLRFSAARRRRAAQASELT
jgi:phosphate transport system substrate-binding protein